MITFGFNTLAMLTYGLGNRMSWFVQQRIRPSIKIHFVDKPPGIDIEDKSVPTTFEDAELSFIEGEIRFKDR